MIELPTAEDPVKVIHGDCLDVLRAMPDGCVDAVVTDPPYCSGAATEAGGGSATHQGLRSETMRGGRFDWFDADNMTTSGLMWLLRNVCVEASRVVHSGGSVIAFCDWRMVTSIGPAMESAGFRLRNLVVWDKGSFGCGTGFRPQHELALHLTKRSPVFHAADVGNVIGNKRVRSAERDHPAEKPVELFRHLIRVVSPPGGLIVDPFAGSGVAGNASILEGRRCLMVEKSAGYVEIIRRRLFTAPPAKLQPSLFD